MTFWKNNGKGSVLIKTKITIQDTALEWLYSPDWEYHDYGDCKRYLQMILPYKQQWHENEQFPLILFIPGSAWLKQEMYNDIPKLTMLAKRGVAVAVMQYREATIAPFPAQVEDVKNAITFLQSKSREFHFDMEQFFLMGNSSGGHIAMMAALLNANGLSDPFPMPKGIVCQCGSTDIPICAEAPLPPWMKVRPSALLLGVNSIEEHRECAEKASCSMYIHQKMTLPPILLMHGDHDPIVSVENSRKLYEKLSESGHAVDYYELQHNTAHCGATYFSEPILDIIEDFISKCQ